MSTRLPPESAIRLIKNAIMFEVGMKTKNDWSQGRISGLTSALLFLTNDEFETIHDDLGIEMVEGYYEKTATK